MQEPQTAKEYIAKVKEEAEKMQGDQIPSHEELIRKYRSEKQLYEERFKQTAGITLLLVIAFLIVKITEGSIISL